MTLRLVPLCGLLAATVALSGCSGAGRVFGLERTPPDEFAVMSRAPLTLPPEYNLRPPRPGAPRPQEAAAPTRAGTTLFGQAPGIGLPAGVSAGEGALLAQAGATDADPEIRQVVDREATDLLRADRSFVDSLLFWREPEAPGDVIDPQAEARRLQSNAAVGAPVNEGEVPVIERRSRAPLEGLFDIF